MVYIHSCNGIRTAEVSPLGHLGLCVCGVHCKTKLHQKRSVPMAEGGLVGPLSPEVHGHVQAWHLWSDQNGCLQYTTAEITLLALRSKGCPAVPTLSLPFSSCSGCFSTDTSEQGQVSSALSPPALPLPHAASARVSPWPHAILRRTAWSSWEGTTFSSSTSARRVGGS